MWRTVSTQPAKGGPGTCGGGINSGCILRHWLRISGGRSCRLSRQDPARLAWKRAVLCTHRSIKFSPVGNHPALCAGPLRAGKGLFATAKGAGRATACSWRGLSRLQCLRNHPCRGHVLLAGPPTSQGHTSTDLWFRCCTEHYCSPLGWTVMQRGGLIPRCRAEPTGPLRRGWSWHRDRP